MTKNNQCKNLIDSSEVFVLGFVTQVGTRDSQFTGQHRPFSSIMYFQQKLTVVRGTHP